MHKYSISLFLVISVLILFSTCKTSKQFASAKSGDFYRFGFYNVENLFDTVDDPVIWDEEFTPDGKKKWTEDRYQKKLNQLAKVINGMQSPALLGLCEVENRGVIQDLINTDALKEKKYQIDHYDSPDKRGIDVALIFNPAVFSRIESQAIPIKIPIEFTPDLPDYTTRDILYSKLLWQKKDTLHVFVNHWPSRRGGLKASEPKRTYVASQLKKKIDSLFSVQPDAAILVMGDFNDETDNNSILKSLDAHQDDTSLQPSTLYNCMAKMDQQKTGTYNYRGNWNMLDQMIVSTTLLQKKNKPFVKNAAIYREEWMMYKNKKYGATPNRTYGGPNYYGGFSDHLPVYLEVD